MKMLFGKYWWLVPAAIVIILALAVVVQYTKDTSEVAEWVFKFLSDWAVILSATAGLLVVFGALLAIRENRRSEARRKIRQWAEECLKHFDEISIAIYRTDGPIVIKGLDIYSDLRRLEVPGKSAYSSANILGEETRKKTKAALGKLHEVIIAFKKRDENVWGEMPKVAQSFSELIDYLSKKEL